MYWATGEPYQSSLIPEDAFMQRFDRVILANGHHESGMLGIFAAGYRPRLKLFTGGVFCNFDPSGTFLVKG